MGLINIPQVTNGDSLTQEFFNSRFALIADTLNGNVDSANLANNAVITSKLANNAVTAVKIETQQAWQAVVYANGWADYDATEWFGGQYYKDSLGIVHLRGLLRTGTVTSGTTMFTLPAGYRPGRKILQPTMSNNNLARIELHTDGTAKTNAGVAAGWVTIANISFRAEG